MAFGKKTNQIETKEQFALVLNPVRGELSKSRMIERMAQVFPLAIDEADDLVENTPIILLEGLEREMGEQIRNYFRETGADLVLTDDGAFKRRCFRAIWPSPPKFDFLRTESSSADLESPAPLNFTSRENSDSAANHAISSAGSVSANTVFDSASPAVQENPVREFETPEPESQSKPMTEPHTAAPDDSDDIWRKNKLQRIELATANAIQEQKITKLADEKGKLQSLILNLQKENDELKTEQLKALQIKKDSENTRARLMEEIKTIDLEKKTLEGNLRQIEADRATFIKARQNEVKLMEERFRESESRLKEEKAKLETQIADLKGAAQTQKLQLDRANEKVQSIFEELQARDSGMKQQKIEAASLRVESEELKRMLTQTQAQVIEHKKESDVIRANFEEKLQEKSNEVELWQKKSDEAIHVHSNLIREAEALRQKHAGDLEHITVRNQELQNQLEAAQRQLREFASVAEQQDLVNKRNQISVQLSDKEARLRELCHRQEILEHDAEEQRQVLQSTLTEREALEREISKDRQAQKYFLEQLKLKEKTRVTLPDRLRPKNSFSGGVMIQSSAEGGLQKSKGNGGTEE